VRGEPRLLLHGVSAEDWTARWGVEPFTHPCSKCGEPLTTTRPFVQGSLRGLESPPCVNGCHDGHNRPPYAIVRDPAYGDLFSGSLNE
jgi:hypothetical protein